MTDIQILYSQIIIFCTAFSVDRAFGISFRKTYSIYRYFYILYFHTFHSLQIFLRSIYICSERTDIVIYILRFILRTSEWVLPFRVYPVKYIKLYFISIYYTLIYFAFAPYTHIYFKLNQKLVSDLKYQT